jgi:hypothetical protein
VDKAQAGEKLWYHSGLVARQSVDESYAIRHSPLSLKKPLRQKV